MNRLWRSLRNIRIRPLWLAAAVLSGILLHLGLVLWATHLGLHRGFSTLAKLGPVNQMAVLAPVTAEIQPVAYLSPSERYAICRYDLRKGPVTVKAKLGDDDWIVAVYDPNGANVFSVRGADLARREIELTLASKDDAAGLALPIANDDRVETTLGLDDRTGIAVIEAPATRIAYAGQTAQFLSQASCALRPKGSGG